ncbi:MAG TPA: M28 family peptidase [Blastocatellia bacterium]|nr:M28 family peptidase [Blastocatellia bacterium]
MNHRHSPVRVLAALALAALFIGSSTGAANLPLPTTEATSSITKRDLKMHLSFLASEELGGRYTLSPSNRVAARYLASQLESYGYRGAARDGSFFQRVPLSFRDVDRAASAVTLNIAGIGGAKREFTYADAFLADVPTDMNIGGELAFVGYGLSSPRNNYDDYAGLNVKGKIVVIASGTPDSLKGVRLNIDEQADAAALAHGAVGAIKIPDAQTLLTWDQLKFWLGGRQQLGLPPRKTAAGKVLPQITAGPDLIKAIARVMGKQSSDLVSPAPRLKPAELAASAEIKLRVDVKEAPPAQNVAAILDGADPKLKDEYVVFSAHYDHLKTGDKGEVYQGADDDGSGTVSVLEIAQAFSLGPRPRRSILIVFHTGEEIGLFGSEYNTDYEPVVPLDKLVANLNIDMVGRSRPAGDTDPRDAHLTDKDSIYIIGADKLSTELNRLNEETNLATSRMKFDYTYNDEKHPERFYYRSDHYNYAKHGIPVIFYFTGVHRDYHRTSDVVEKIDFEKMERIGRMIFATGWRVANLDHRLVVDKRQ